VITLADITEWLSSFKEIVQTRGVVEGFVAGLALGFVLPMGVIILWKLASYKRRRCREIVISGQDGDLHISVNAVREFVRRIITEFREAELKTVALRRRGARKIINVSLNVVPGTDLVGLQNTVAERIKSEAAKKLGLDRELGRVNVWVYEYSADEDKIAKRARKVQPEAELPRPEDEDQSQEEEPVFGASN
jgi:hypothetical protein